MQERSEKAREERMQLRVQKRMHERMKGRAEIERERERKTKKKGPKDPHAILKFGTPRFSRPPPDYSSNLCPPITFAIYDFLGGVLGLLPVVFLYINGPKHPLKKNHI